MVDAVASIAVQTLWDLLIEEVKVISGVNKRVEDVRRELIQMRCFLRDADNWEERNSSHEVHNWVLELKNLATKAEDVLERHALEIESRREGTLLKKLLKGISFSAVHGIGEETDFIMSRMTELTKKLESINKRDGSSNPVVSNDHLGLLRKTYGHEVVEHFVGMKDDLVLLISLMKSDDRLYRVISICGMGGLGKTTLARKIYQNDDVQFGFEALAWVCITQQFQAKTVYQEILQQLGCTKQVNGMEEGELVRELYNIQKHKKCLVVLDDLWEVDHWNILSCSFPIADSNIKILITTRNQRIAKMEFVLKLQCLSEDESWDLLQKIALPSIGSQGLSRAQLRPFEDKGREIVRKCGGLPLAISVIGGILQGKQTLSEWENVNRNIDSYLKNQDGVGKDAIMAQVLNLSYNVLPYYLKSCFLYLGCFPEDKDVDVEELYLIWMAEGMISSDDIGRNETLRDVAERYLNELACRCMVQVKKNKSSAYRRFLSCHIHDLMRDLCLSKGKEEEFLELVHFQIPHASFLGKTRRLVIHMADVENYIPVQFRTKNL